MRTPAGFLLPMNNQNTFEKPPLSIDAQIERLASRGIVKILLAIISPILATIDFVVMLLSLKASLLMEKSNTAAVRPLSKY
jgi:hypothetical protein